MANIDIRIRMVTAGVKLYEVARELGMADSSLSRKLRCELSEAETDRIMAAIERLAARTQHTTGINA